MKRIAARYEKPESWFQIPVNFVIFSYGQIPLVKLYTLSSPPAVGEQTLAVVSNQSRRRKNSKFKNCNDQITSCLWYCIASRCHHCQGYRYRQQNVGYGLWQNLTNQIWHQNTIVSRGRSFILQNRWDQIIGWKHWDHTESHLASPNICANETPMTAYVNNMGLLISIF